LRCRKLVFGLTPLADVRADAIQADDQGAQFTLYVRGQKVLVRLAVPGQFQVMNALAAAAAAHGAGASLDAIAQGLGRFRPVAMRMQLISHASGALLINDAYNANPSSVRASIANLCQGYPQRSRWLVLGDMRELGPAARSEHRDLGVWMATQSLQRVYLYGRDTRFVLEGLKSKNPSFAVQRFRKKRLLVAELQKSLTEKPVILFKGSRSMRMEQLVGELSSPAAVSGGSISGFPLSRE
jgi:UDP-N-acetylmuramoyl-tripeptide--D-alanyl-D-alanine ligase